MAESEEELKSLLMKVKEESEKAGLKLNIQKMKIMASSLIFIENKWRNNGNSDRLYFLGLQKQHRWWLQPWNSKTCAPWKKRYDKLSMLKNRDITWPTNIQIVRVMVFPVVMHGFDSWTIKKAECLRIDAFELWFWRRLLRVLWTTRRSNQSVLKEINPEYSLEGLMLRLKL